MNGPYLNYQLALMRAREVEAKAETAWRLPPAPARKRRIARLHRRHSCHRQSQPIKSGV
ncbi:MAG TPA: hypothetical protein VKS25_13510 [Solirubrobacteraceae bacterium]|nr:hypothetical protein [Solirubrobacteraceae bacterium]